MRSFLRQTPLLVAAIVALSASSAWAATAPSNESVVESAIAQSPISTRVPSSLTPALASVTPSTLLSLQGSSMVDNCNPYGNPSLVNAPVPCWFGSTTATRVVVAFGDSSMGNWLPALASAMKVANYKLAAFVFPGCPTLYPVPGSVSTPLTNAMATQCTKYRTTVPAAIAALHPTAVIVSRLATGWSGNLTIDIAQWRATFAQIAPSGAKRYIMMSTPNLPQVNVPVCLGLNHTIDQCSPRYNVKSTSHADDYYSEMMRDINSAKVLSVPLISTYQWFCQLGRPGTNVCPAVIKNYLVYVDEEHITTAYMQFITPAVTDALRAAGFK